ncbi:MAG: hypothetical protein WCT52_01840 [Candidatus Micrarchaeia archaeon]
MEGKSFEDELEEFVAGVITGKKELAIERKMLLMSVASFALLLLAGAGAYEIYLKNISEIGKFVPYLIYTAISAVALTAAIAHYYAHRRQFACMEGMMVGMTIGMMGGFLFGAIIGATNGMFVGSVFGMAIGMVAGAWCGKCCGIMGLMEGLMGGLMAGTMGAMLTVMMAFDNLALFMPILIASCLAIMGCFAYMVHETAGQREKEKAIGFAAFFALALLLSIITAAAMLFAPRSSAVVL